MLLARRSAVPRGRVQGRREAHSRAEGPRAAREGDGAGRAEARRGAELERDPLTASRSARGGSVRSRSRTRGSASAARSAPRTGGTRRTPHRAPRSRRAARPRWRDPRRFAGSSTIVAPRCVSVLTVASSPSRAATMSPSFARVDGDDHHVVAVEDAAADHAVALDACRKNTSSLGRKRRSIVMKPARCSGSSAGSPAWICP